MSTRLWSKPDNRRHTMYRELFDSLSPEFQSEFKRWDGQLSHFEWKHRFLHYRNSPVKSESTAEKSESTREWRKAMEMYKQALCFAENGSEYLSVLFAKRGFCFSNMEMHAAGIDDIDLALKRNLSLEWVAECRENMEILKGQSKPYESLMPKLSFEFDDDYPAMANVLELKFDANNCAYIVTKVDIVVGKTVLLEESFTAVTNCYDKTCCATCLNEIRNFMPCPTCTDAVFCSINCYKRNYVHRVSCGENFHRMPTPVKFVVQSILQAISVFPSIDLMIQFVEAYIKSPNPVAAAAKFKMPLDAKMRDYGLFLKQKIQNSMPIVTVYQAYTTLLSLASVSKRLNTRTKKRFLMHLVGHHAMVLNSNAFGGFEVNQNRFISGTMANLVAMIEHSCTPNVVHFAYGDREVCITVRPIRAGERLCYDYWPEDDGDYYDDQRNGDGCQKRMELRKQKLWENWRMDCQCPKCGIRPLDLKPNPQMAADPVFFHVSNYKRYFNNSDQCTLEALKQKCIHFLNKFKDEAWSKEMEVITKAYCKCILDEYNRRYGP